MKEKTIEEIDQMTQSLNIELCTQNVRHCLVVDCGDYWRVCTGPSNVEQIDVTEMVNALTGHALRLGADVEEHE